MKDNRGAAALRKLGLSQGTVAHAVGCHQSQVSRFERGERKPETKHRVQFAKIYEIGWDWWDKDCDSDSPAVSS